MEETKEVKKLSYEELEKIALELNERCVKLFKDLQSLDLSNLFKRLDYLFKIAENKDVFPVDFVETCTKEIMTLMQQEKQEESKEEA